MTLRPLFALFFAFGLACAGGKDAPDDGTLDDSVTSSDDSADDSTVADDSTPTDDTFAGEVFERTDPIFSVSFAGATWTSVTGYYTGGQGGSFINASGGDADRSQTVTVAIDGNLRYAGEYPITSIHYAEGPAQAPVDVDYSIEHPEGVTFVVEGYAEERYIFGHMTGSATLTDAYSGGTAVWTDMTLVSWPRF